MSDGIRGLLSRDGQTRRRALDELVQSLEYYIPPELRGTARFIGEMSPSAAHERATLATRDLIAPDRTMGERLQSGADLALDTAGLAAFPVALGRLGRPAQEVGQELLLGMSVNPQAAARQADEVLALPPPDGRQDSMFRPDPDTPAFPDTRGLGVRFHGARAEIPQLQTDYVSGGDTNIYGNAFYTTDAVAPSAGYRRGAEEGVVYRVDEVNPVNAFDMEQTVPTWLEKETSTMEGLYGDLLSEALSENPRNVREFFDNVRELSPQYDLPRYEVQEVFDELHSLFRQRGFNALDHVGGLKTNRAPHNVRIYLDPAEQVRLNQVDPISPLGSQTVADSQKNFRDGGRVTAAEALMATTPPQKQP